MPPQGDRLVRLLGPIDIRIGDVRVPVAGTRRKAVLAAIALSAGRTVSAERLVDIVWSGQPPATATNTLQSHISFLRRLFGARDVIVSTAPGYRLDLAGDATDVRAAERLVAEAERATEAADRAAALRSALALWRSRPLADLDAIAWFTAQAERMERLRAHACTSLIDARLSLGEHLALIPELEDLAERRRFDEALHAQLMIALYRSGRQADALAVFRSIRALLRDELGIDPGEPLRELETAMLRQDSSLDLPGTTITAAAPRGPYVVPAQLPPALPHFVGREAELELLDDTTRPSGPERTSAICAVSGPPGVGKTSLAVAWAHRVAPEFPDGQLYVNLRGFGPQAEIMDAAEALHGFLEALGVPPQRIPETLNARVGLYRSVLAGRRVLVLLDNAHDADQIRPLLPGSRDSLVLVTSRNRLTSLVATDAAVAMPVDVLPRPTAHALLAQRLGQKRIAHEPDAVDEIIDRCAGLPLALSIVAARAATEPAVSLATIAGQMLATTDTLDTLSGGDRSADIRAVISWSYAVLSPDAARLFRHLALHPAGEFGVRTAASVAAISTSRARGLLGEIAGGNLLMTLGGERYTFHDLIRAYAIEQAYRHDSEADRAEVLRRLLEHYLHTAHAAAGLLDVYRDSIVSTPPGPGITPTPLGDHEQALEWFMREYPTLLAVVHQATESGMDEYTWKIACSLIEFLERRGLWQDWLMALDAAATAAERLSDRRALAYSHRGLGRAHHWLGNYADADAHHRQALSHFTHLGDRLGQARVWHSLGRLAELRGDLGDALVYTQQGLDLFRAADDRPGIAKALNGVGWYHCLLGDHERALQCCSDALVLLQELGDRRVEANTWDSLGYAHHQAGNYGTAIDCYEQALAIFRDIGDRFHEADASAHLGDTYAAAGDPAAARSNWRRALLILDDLRHVDALEVREKLTEHAMSQVA